MRAATIHVETDGIGFTIDAGVGQGDGGEHARSIQAYAPTIAGALRQLADKFDVIAAGKPLPDDLLRRIETLLDSPGGRNGYDTIKAVRQLFEDHALRGDA